MKFIWVLFGFAAAKNVMINEKEANEVLDAKISRQKRASTGCWFPPCDGVTTAAVALSESQLEVQKIEVYKQLTLDHKLISVESWGELKERLENNANVDRKIPEQLEHCISPCKRENWREKVFSRNGNSHEEKKETQEKLYEETGSDEYDFNKNPVFACTKCYQYIPSSVPGAPSKMCFLINQPALRLLMNCKDD